MGAVNRWADAALDRLISALMRPQTPEQALLLWFQLGALALIFAAALIVLIYLLDCAFINLMDRFLIWLNRD
jgi:hypothetical protein